MKALQFIKKESVLCAAAVLWAVTCPFTPSLTASAANINTSVLMLLFSLMAVTAGLKCYGVFDWIISWIYAHCSSVRMMASMVTALCFIIAMFLTNDVALLSFIPLTIILFSACEEKYLIRVITLETIAANLGSMMTPIGNPQNIYLYEYYRFDIAGFLRCMLPLGIAAALGLAASMLTFPAKAVTIAKTAGDYRKVDGRSVAFGIVFVLCLLAVLKVVPYWICLLAAAAAMAATSWRLFGKIDYLLLLTFVFFFLLVGNLKQLEVVIQTVKGMLEGRELAAGILLSQVISNVPAAVMLSGFTDKGTALLAGTNIGGLGTVIASLASLISFRFYSGRKGSAIGRYLCVFTVWNLIFLLVMVVVELTIG